MRVERFFRVEHFQRCTPPIARFCTVLLLLWIFTTKARLTDGVAVATGPEGPVEDPEFLEASSGHANGRIVFPEATITVDTSGWMPVLARGCRNDKVLLNCKLDSRKATAPRGRASFSWLWVSAEYTNTGISLTRWSVHGTGSRGSCRHSALVKKLSSARTFALGCFNEIANGTLFCRVKTVVGGHGGYCAHASVGIQHLRPSVQQRRTQGGNPGVYLGGIAFMLTAPSWIELQYRKQSARSFHVQLKCLTYSGENIFWSFQADKPAGRRTQGLQTLEKSLEISHFDDDYHGGVYTCSSVGDAGRGKPGTSLSTHLSTPGHGPIRLVPVLQISPSNDLLTYAGQNVTVRCYSPNPTVTLSWGSVATLLETAGATVHSERVALAGTAITTTAIVIHIPHIQDNAKFRCRGRSLAGHRGTSRVQIHVRRALPLPSIKFWTEFKNTTLVLNWAGDTSRQAYTVWRWTVSYQTNTTGPWRLVPSAGFIQNNGNGALNSVRFQSYSPCSVYQFRIFPASTNLTQNYSEHVQLFQATFSSPLVFHPKDGPVSSVSFQLLSNTNRYISCRTWAGRGNSSTRRQHQSIAFGDGIDRSYTEKAGIGVDWCSSSVKKLDVSPCPSAEEQQNQWREHFLQVPNVPSEFDRREIDLIRRALVVSIGRFIRTVCATCRLHSSSTTKFYCRNKNRLVSFTGELLYPNVESHQIQEYIDLLSDGQLAVTLLARLARSPVPTTEGHRCPGDPHCRPWPFKLESVCVLPSVSNHHSTMMSSAPSHIDYTSQWAKTSVPSFSTCSRLPHK